jgi:YYY domain-containing protein
VLAVLGGFALADLLSWASKRSEEKESLQRGLGQAAYGAVAAGLALALFFGVAYLSIYGRPVTRVEASRWMYQNLPAGSAIATEHWDDTVPMRLPGSPDKQFRLFELGLYELDTPQKVEKLIDDLDGADYIVLSSNRLLNSIPRNPVNYPVTSRYYELLLEEQLGFQLVREFLSYPSFLGIELPDSGSSSEALTSYDHPPVLVFEKAPDYSRARLESLLGEGPFAAASLTPAQADRNGLLLSAEDAASQQAGGAWTDVFSNSAIVRDYPALLWFLVVQAAALAVTPVALVLFRRLPDRGYLLAKPLGLLLLAYPVWLIVSLEFVHFSRESVLGVLAVLLAGGGVVAWQRREEIGAFLRTHWRLVLFSELLFAAAFLFFLLLRFENPDLWHPHRGGEKPMDLAYLTALARSTTLPPYDPWFSGGYINYYYLGHFFTATLMKATSIPPQVAFNLAVPAYFALTVGAAFSVGFNLAAAARNYLRRDVRRRIPGWSLYAAGLAGAAFVALLGNLDGVGQTVERLSEVSAWQVDAPVVGAVLNSLGGLWQVAFNGADLKPFDFWRSSRMMPPAISITEFPYFTFLFADLHAHLMAIPFEVLAVGVSLSLVLGHRGEQRGWQEWGVVALLGLIAGSLRWLNSWDYPPFLLIAVVAVAISERRLEGGAMAATKRLVLKALLLVGLSYLLYVPFLDSYQAPVSGVHATPETTPVHQYLAHFGLFAVAFGLWLAYLAARALKPSPLLTYLTTSETLSDRSRAWLTITGLVAGSVLIVMLVLIADGRPLVAFLLPLLVLVAYLALRELRLRRSDGGLRLFLLSLVGLGLGLSAGVEFVTINGDIQRMNTVFKFYLHIWVVFALVSSFAVWSLIFVYWRPALEARPAPSWHFVAGAGKVALAGLVLGALLYPVFATPVRLDDRFAELPGTLDGTAYMPHAVYNDARGPIDLAQDYDGILWLRENVEGTPVIVEGRGDLYSWTSRFSIYTGLPAVVGWDWHQRQQRGDFAFMVDQRNRQVDVFYTDPDPDQALSFLRRYGVQYVILGQVERLYYPQSGLLKFQDGLDGALEVVFRNAGLVIFEVRRDALARYTAGQDAMSRDEGP